MTAVIDHRPTPWGLLEIDSEVVLAEVRRVLPGAVVWAGEYTGSFWFLHAGRLEEYADGRALLARVRAIAAPKRPMPPQAPRCGDVPASAVSPRTSGHAVPQRLAPAVDRAPATRRRPSEPFFPPPNRFRRFIGRCRGLLRTVGAEAL